MVKEKFIKLIPVHVYSFAPIQKNVVFEVLPLPSVAKNSWYYVRLLLRYYYFSEDLQSIDVLVYADRNNIDDKDYFDFCLYKRAKNVKKDKIIRSDLKSFHRSLKELGNKNGSCIYAIKLSKLLDLISYYKPNKLLSFLCVVNTINGK